MPLKSCNPPWKKLSPPSFPTTPSQNWDPVKGVHTMSRAYDNCSDKLGYTMSFSENVSLNLSKLKVESVWIPHGGWWSRALLGERRTLYFGLMKWPYLAEGSYSHPPPPAIFPPLLFFKFCPTSNHLLPPPLLFLLPDFFDWIGDHISFNMCFTHLKSCYFGTRRTLLCVLCKQVSSLLRSDTYCSFLLVLWFDMTQTHEDTYLSQGPIDWYTHINIY